MEGARLPSAKLVAMSVEVTTKAIPACSGVPLGSFTLRYTRSTLVANCLVAGRPWLLSGGLIGWTGWGPTPVNLRAFASNEALEIGGIAQLLFAYLEQPTGGVISGTEYLHLLETTEKSHASARLGAGIAAMLAWTVLGVQALHHLGQVPSGLLGVAPGAGQRRPDYVGRLGPYAPYSVFEAKGTTGPAAGSTAVSHAKAQARTITSVGGVPIQHAVACMGRVPLAPASISGVMVDPPSENGADLPEDALEGREVVHYGPIARAMAGEQPMLPVASGAAEQDRIELFPMGPAGFFGALGTVASAIRDLAARPPTTPVEADHRLEEARSSISDSRLPAALPGTPGIARGGWPTADSTSQPAGLLRIADRAYELVILPDGIVFAFDRALTST